MTSPFGLWILISWIWSSGAVNSLADLLSTGSLLARASFRFDHQSTPLSTASSALAVSRPFDFIGYLLFHQVANPNPTTASGKTTMLSQNAAFSFRVVRLSGRSSGDFGRTEI